MSTRELMTLMTGLSLACAALASGKEAVLPAPGTDGWQPLTFLKIKQHTTYAIVREDGENVLRAQADCSASALYYPLENITLTETPRLHWRWKVTHGLQIADERVKAGDDFAARVYVTFRFDAQHASLWQRARHALGTALYGGNIPGNAINYVWSSHEPAGATWDNPFASESKMVSLGSGPLPQWTEETVDVAAGYKSFFGVAPPPLLAVAVMTDSDGSCQEATAYYTDFRFETPTR